jgi:hypothetical protein
MQRKRLVRRDGDRWHGNCTTSALVVTTERKKSKKKLPRATTRTATAKVGARRTGRRWSKQVMETSDALDLEPGVFRERDPHRIALSLKRSAERSRRRKSEPYRSAMSMLTFYINRGGRSLSATRKRVLERAKTELRKLYGKEGS